MNAIILSLNIFIFFGIICAKTDGFNGVISNKDVSTTTQKPEPTKYITVPLIDILLRAIGAIEESTNSEESKEATIKPTQNAELPTKFEANEENIFHQKDSTTNQESKKVVDPMLSAAGLLDSLTTTAEVKECPGICVLSIATIICYEVLEDVQCPPEMKCCAESNKTSQAVAQSQAQSTTQKPMRTTTLAPKTSKPTENNNAPATTPRPAPPPKCPGYCMLDILEAFCQAPAIPLRYKTSSCEEGLFCCDNTRLATTSPTTSTTHAPTTTQQPDYRENTAIEVSTKENHQILTDGLFQAIEKPSEKDTEDQSTAITPTETTTLKNLTSEPTQIAEATIKSETNEEDGSCLGICVDDIISSVCGLITDGLCKTGTTCCIQRDSYHYKNQKHFHHKNQIPLKEPYRK